MIPASRPHLLHKDFNYIHDLVLSRQISGGPLTKQLENEMCNYLGVDHAIATSNGTAALHLALLALKVGPGDEVIFPSYVCAALLHASYYVGAKPVLTDIDPLTFNPTPAMFRACVSPRTKAIVVTHTFGFPADVAPILALGIPVIEDCAQALGAQYQKRFVGSLGSIGVFSFYATKMISAGEGGMLCTNDSRLARRLQDLNTPDLLPRYQVRYNYKMSDLTAGLALSQFRRVDAFLSTRRRLAERYKAVLDNSLLLVQDLLPGTESAYYRFVIRCPKPAVLMQSALEQGIICDRPVYRPIHYYTRPPRSGAYKNTNAVWRSAVSIPLYPDLDEVEVSQILEFLTQSRARFAVNQSSAHSIGAQQPVSNK